MTTTAQWWVNCDICGESTADIGSLDFTSAQAVQTALAIGWHRRPSKPGHICDICWDEGKR